MLIFFICAIKTTNKCHYYSKNLTDGSKISLKLCENKKKSCFINERGMIATTALSYRCAHCTCRDVIIAERLEQMIDSCHNYN